MKGKKSKPKSSLGVESLDSHCQETLSVELLMFLIWPSVDNKLLGVNKDTILNPFNGDSSLSRIKYHANQFLAD